jgi:hypothetical protein
MSSTSPRRFEYVPAPDWPLLAWLARCEAGRDTITVFHGPRVDATDDWFCEATWAGDFQAGDFDRTDIVAGSGGRLRDGKAIFVSSASTVDRLQSLRTPGATWVSNSLACLAAVSGAEIDETSGRYFWLFRTIVRGIRRYRPLFPTSAGPVALTYFDNLVWDGRDLTPAPKPGGDEDFGSFAKYHGYLQRSLEAVAANAASRHRRHRYDLLSTASSGYDSSTITVLARQAGATHVLCFDQARRGLDDSGEPLARALGMTPIVAERGAWMSRAGLPEVPFVASDSHGGDVFFTGAEEALRGKVLLTGYHGDKIWAKRVHTPLDDTIVRGDQSGLSLTEYRLGIGMLHCPVSFWGVRQIRALHAISNAPEMRPWDIPGDYSRPICRRIVEQAGVPREMFGMEKKASWVLMLGSREFMSPASTRDYYDWLRERRTQWLRRGRLPPLVAPRFDELELGARKAAGEFASAERAAWYRTALRRTGAMRLVHRFAEGPTQLRRYVFAWAFERQRRAYPRPG